MATLPSGVIEPVPAESPEPTSDFPAIDPINTFDRVGPTAANRQPTALKQRDFTLRDRVNLLIANMNEVAEGATGDTVLFLPRDGTNAMLDDLDMGGKKFVNYGVLLAAPTGTPDDYVQVSTGTYQKIDGLGQVVFAGGSKQIGPVTADPRYDVLYLDDAGALQLVAGAEAGSPTVPDFPSDGLALAVIYIDETSGVVINQADITDVRPFLSGDQNARRIQDRPVAATSPGAGDAYLWSGSEWAPGAVGGWTTLFPAGGPLNTQIGAGVAGTRYWLTPGAYAITADWVITAADVIVAGPKSAIVSIDTYDIQLNAVGTELEGFTVYVDGDDATGDVIGGSGGGNHGVVLRRLKFTGDGHAGAATRLYVVNLISIFGTPGPVVEDCIFDTHMVADGGTYVRGAATVQRCDISPSLGGPTGSITVYGVSSSSMVIDCRITGIQGQITRTEGSTAIVSPSYAAYNTITGCQLGITLGIYSLIEGNDINAAAIGIVGTGVGARVVDNRVNGIYVLFGGSAPDHGTVIANNVVSPPYLGSDATGSFTPSIYVEGEAGDSQLYGALVISSNTCGAEDNASERAWRGGAIYVALRHTTVAAGTYGLLGGVRIGGFWRQSKAYALNEFIRPGEVSPYVYEATVAGTSGATYPVWPRTPGATVVDGGVTWTCRTSYDVAGTSRVGAMVAGPVSINNNLCGEIGLCGYGGGGTDTNFRNRLRGSIRGNDVVLHRGNYAGYIRTTLLGITVEIQERNTSPAADTINGEANIAIAGNTVSGQRIAIGGDNTTLEFGRLNGQYMSLVGNVGRDTVDNGITWIGVTIVAYSGNVMRPHTAGSPGAGSVTTNIFS